MNELVPAGPAFTTWFQIAAWILGAIIVGVGGGFELRQLRLTLTKLELTMESIFQRLAEHNNRIAHLEGAEEERRRWINSNQ